MRAWALELSQSCVAAWVKSVCPDTTTSVPSSMSGWSTDMAPLKKFGAFGSAGPPPNSSML